MTNTATGLRSARKGESRFPNFIWSDLVLKEIDYEPFGSQFAQLAFCDSLFFLRVSSEALQHRRAFSSDAMNLFQASNDKALVTVRYESEFPQLTLRLAYRKNLSTGCVLYRPCFSGLSPASAGRIRAPPPRPSVGAPHLMSGWAGSASIHGS